MTRQIYLWLQKVEYKTSEIPNKITKIQEQ